MDYCEKHRRLVKAGCCWLYRGFWSSLAHSIKQSREREKWILDSKKAEYRELLSALSQAHMSTTELSAGYAAFTDDPQKYSSIARIQNDSYRIFSDRIFIRNDLALNDLQQAWRKAMDKYSSSPNWSLAATLNPLKQPCGC